MWINYSDSEGLRLRSQIDSGKKEEDCLDQYIHICIVCRRCDIEGIELHFRSICNIVVAASSSSSLPSPLPLSVSLATNEGLSRLR